jgi:hypothetical protein
MISSYVVATRRSSAIGLLSLWRRAISVDNRLIMN